MDSDPRGDEMDILIVLVEYAEQCMGDKLKDDSLPKKRGIS